MIFGPSSTLLSIKEPLNFCLSLHLYLNSLSLFIMLNVNKITDSPAGTRFMVPSPPPEVDGRECWPPNLHEEYSYYLERSLNRSVLTGLKREDHRRWLRNPSGKLQGETTQERAEDANKRTQILANFELQDNQVYRKSETIKGHLFPARYAVCVWDSFDIICRIHRSLKHFGEFRGHVTRLPLFYPASKMPFVLYPFIN
jgi:hypothetical protein